MRDFAVALASVIVVPTAVEAAWSVVGSSAWASLTTQAAIQNAIWKAMCDNLRKGLQVKFERLVLFCSRERVLDGDVMGSRSDWQARRGCTMYTIS